MIRFAILIFLAFTCSYQSTAQIVKTSGLIYFNQISPNRTPSNLNSESEFAYTIPNNKTWVWNRTTSAWEAQKTDLASLTQGGATTGQIIAWNGTAWTPTTISTATTISGIGTVGSPLSVATNSLDSSHIKAAGISNTDLSRMGASSGQVLKWNGTVWAPSTDNVGGGGGSSFFIYSAGSGCMVSATGAGVTFTRTTASNWTISVPVGIHLVSADIYSTTAQNPGSNVTININTLSTVYNQDITTALIPIFSGVAISGGTGTYVLTTGTPNLQPTIAVAPTNGDVQYLINNYNTASALGTGDSILKINF